MKQTTVREYVVNLLKNHNTLEQEYKALIFERTQLERLLPEETIQSMVFAPRLGERVDSSKISNTTTDVALSYQQNYQEMKRSLLAEIDIRVNWLESTLHRLNFYIDGLEACQASILRDYYFQGYSWRELQDLRGVTYKTLMKYRDDAVTALSLRYARLEKIGLIEIERENEMLDNK